jgi:hypothetical protein
MRVFILMLLIATALSGCGATIGPVNHSCVYPNMDSSGSGCDSNNMD